MNIAKKFFNWLKKGSPNNAANPNPKAAAYNTANNNTFGPAITPLEISSQQEIVLGSFINIGNQDLASRGPNGEMLYSYKNLSFLAGCGHVISQLHAQNESGKTPIRGVGGRCLYCDAKYQQMAAKGLMSLDEADRRSLVCSECARVTVSGILCCPMHYTAIGDGNGNFVYLGPQEIEDQKRKDLVNKILSPFTSFLPRPQLPNIEDKDE